MMPHERTKTLLAPLNLVTRRRRFQMLALMLVLSVAFFGFYTQVWKDAPYIQGDTSGYTHVAQDIENGDFGQLWGRTPGYPILLALTNSAFTPSRSLYLVQLTFHLLSCILVAYCLYRLRASRFLIGLFLGIALLPPYAETALFVLTENATETMLVFGTVALILWFLSKNVLWMPVTGLAFSLAAMIRPTYALLVPTVIAFILGLALFRLLKLRRKRLAVSIFLLLVPYLLVEGGYVVYNKLKFDYLGISPWIGYSLTVRTSSFIGFLPPKYDSVRQVFIDARNQDFEGSTSRMAGAMYVYSVQSMRQSLDMNETEFAKYLQTLNLDLIRAQPVKYLRSIMNGLLDYWTPELSKDAIRAGVPNIPWSLLQLAVVLIFFASLLLLTVLAAVRLCYTRLWDFLFRQRTEPSPAFLTLLSLWLVIFYTYGISIAIDIGIPRHRKPTDVLILFACVLSVATLLRLRQRIDWSIRRHEAIQETGSALVTS